MMSAALRPRRVLCVWEFGGGLGHIGQLIPVAKALRNHGCEVTFVCRTLPGVAAWLAREGFPFVQAPRAPITPGASARPASFASILTAVGFGDRERLQQLVGAWRSFFLLAKPDVLIVNYAPIAQLAARLLGIRSVEIGEGFSIPPRESPFPPLSSVSAAPIGEESAALTLTNELLQHYGLPGLDRLCDVLFSDETFLCTFKEFDHYPGRANARYCGPLFSQAEGATPAWKNNGRPKVFGYLKADYPDVDKLISRLGKHALDAVVFLAGASASLRAHAEREGITVSVEAIDIPTVAATCDAGICHSGPGTTIALLLAGKPVLLLPMQFEQSLTAANAQKAGLGRWLKPGCSDEQFDVDLDTVLNEPMIHGAARTFQVKYSDFDRQMLAITVAEAALQLAN